MKNIVFIIWGILLSTGMLGNVTFYYSPSNSTAGYGDPVAVDVLVDDFTDIAAMQFSINWDPTALTFVNVDNFNLSSLSFGNVGTLETTNGKLTCAWIDNGTNGVTVSNGTAIFRLHFTAIGLPGSSATISFSDDPTPQAVYDPVPTAVPFTNQTATVNIAACSPSIYGNTHRENGTSVQGVNVALTGIPAANEVTTTAGNYAFCSLTNSNSYTVTPTKSGDASECVTVLDALKILRHVFGADPLPSAYAMLRADANNSNGISIADAVNIRNVVLGKNTSFPKDTWTFVPADYVFQDPQDPWADVIPPFSEADPLNGDEQFDFIALKTGDVTDCDETPNATFLSVEVPQVTANIGESIIIDVTVDDFTDLTGLQFSLSWDPSVIQYTGLQGMTLSGLTTTSFNTDNTSTGEISMAWYADDLQGHTLSNGSILFQLAFDVIGAGGSQSYLDFVETPTTFEVVDENCETSGLNYTNGSVAVRYPVVFNASDLILGAGQTGCVDVSVEGFTNILTAQASIHFDPTVVRLTHVQNFGLPDMTNVNFNLSNGINGQMNFAYLDPNFLGVTVPDGTTIFEVCFAADTTDCGSTAFNFTSSPAPIEVTDVNFNFLAVQVNDGNIIADTLPPMITCPPDTVVSCDSSSFLLGEPVVVDCTPFTIDYLDNQVASCGPIYQSTIERTWAVTDTAGNVATCVQKIETLPIDLNNMTAPPDTIVPGTTINFDPDSLGTALYNGQPYSPGAGDCFISITYLDSLYTTGVCPYFTKIKRTWQAVNWCAANPTLIIIGHQIITIDDSVPPTILDCPANGIYLDAPLGTCMVDVFWQEPEVATPGVNMSSNFISGDAFPVGTTTVTYTATSPCGFMSTCSFDVIVLDNEAPLAFCEDNIEVVLSSAGTADIWTTDIDEGSMDNCSIASLEVTLDFNAFSQVVVVDCNHGGGGPFDVYLRVTDVVGNVNICNTVVSVDGSMVEWYKDEDGDGYSDGTTYNGCSPPPDYYLAIDLTATSGDCNDNNSNVNPGAAEVCNGIDDDCSGAPESSTNTWTAAGDAITWSDGANWSDGFAPLTCQDVVIPGTYSVLVPLGYDAVAKTLDVALLAELIVDGTLHVED